jgi:hypothetical protein
MERRRAPRNALAAFARLLKFAFAPILARDASGGKCGCGSETETIPAELNSLVQLFIFTRIHAHKTTY